MDGENNQHRSFKLLSLTKMSVPIKTVKITQKNYKIFGFTLLLLSLPFLLISLSSFFSTKKFVRSAISTTGTVVKNEICEGDDTPPNIKPTIIFSTNKGEVIELTSLHCEYPQRFETGETANLLYLENNPHQAKIAKNDYLYLSTLIFGFLSIVFLTISFFILFTEGVNKIEGMPVALFIGGSFIFYGFLFLFWGSSSWANNSGLTLGGILLLIFGMAIIIWEKYKTTLRLKN